MKGAEVSALITAGLGGKANIEDVDCCATRLRCTIKDPEKVQEALLKQSGSRGVILKGKGIQVIYGPQVAQYFLQKCWAKALVWNRRKERLTHRWMAK